MMIQGRILPVDDARFLPRMTHQPGHNQFLEIRLHVGPRHQPERQVVRALGVAEAGAISSAVWAGSDCGSRPELRQVAARPDGAG
jgi:hypothetical protein